MKSIIILFGILTSTLAISRGNFANPCASNDPNNVMVQVGSWCVDKFADVVCDSQKTAQDQKFFKSCISRLNKNNGIEPDFHKVKDAAHNEDGNQLPNVVNHEGQMIVDSYRAYSIDPLDPRLGKPENAVAIETRFITFLQVQTLCKLSGKEPLPEEVWNLAADGTIPCQNVKGTDVCLSKWGVQGMFGHMWELTYRGDIKSPTVIVKGIPDFAPQLPPVEVFSDFSTTAFAHQVTFRCGRKIAL